MGKDKLVSNTFLLHKEIIMATKKKKGFIEETKEKVIGAMENAGREALPQTIGGGLKGGSEAARESFNKEMNEYFGEKMVKGMKAGVEKVQKRWNQDADEKHKKREKEAKQATAKGGKAAVAVGTAAAQSEVFNANRRAKSVAAEERRNAERGRPTIVIPEID